MNVVDSKDVNLLSFRLAMKPAGCEARCGWRLIKGRREGRENAGPNGPGPHTSTSPAACTPAKIRATSYSPDLENRHTLVFVFFLSFGDNIFSLSPFLGRGRSRSRRRGTQFPFAFVFSQNPAAATAALPDDLNLISNNHSVGGAGKNKHG